MKFLGYEIKDGQISPDNTNVESIKKLIPSRNVKELQRFLDSINVYNRFISNYGNVRKPLNYLLKKDQNGDGTANVKNFSKFLKIL